jgi:hypothetical protein
MSKIFLTAFAIAATMTMASAPNAWAGIDLGNGLWENGISLGNGIWSNGINLGNGTSQETLASTALIAVELQR